MSFTVYRSSAGSGKTFTLVKEYLTLALSGEPFRYRNILAITFTNKAAKEMKERVIHMLTQISSNDTEGNSASFLRDDLLKTLKIDDNTLRNRASEVLEHILHHYSDFSISTIDKFTHKITRTFAHDLHIPVNFEVELDGDSLLTEAIDRLISKAGVDPMITRALIDFTEHKAEEEESTNLEARLLKFSRKLLDDDGLLHIQALRSMPIEGLMELRKKMHAEVKRLQSSISEYGIRALNLIEANHIPANAFAHGANGLPKYFEYLADCRIEKFTPNQKVQESVDSDRWHAGKINQGDRDAIDRIRKELADDFYAGSEFALKYRERLILLGSVLQNMYPMMLLSELEKSIAEIRTERNVIHISEFNKRISEIVMNEPIPFIYERIGERYSNFMIDEFQDTSVLQWQNLVPLMDNTLGTGNFCMVVGDGKQAIYRWRGGEVEQFSQLPHLPFQDANPIVKERENTLKRNYNPRVLNTNYRSRREVIEFNNFVFDELSQALPDALSVIYLNQKQEFNPKNTGGFVSIAVHDKDLDAEFKEFCTQGTQTTIEQCRADGFALSEIAILCRSNRQASELAVHLMSEGIPVISSESLLVMYSPKVRFVIDVLQWINNKQNKSFQISILSFLHRIGRLNGVLHTMLEQIAGADEFQNILKAQDIPLGKVSYSAMPLYDAVECIIRDHELTPSEDAYVSFFLDFVLDYTNRQDNVIPNFLQSWENHAPGLSVVIPDGIEAVRIMTIHKSKGLEFPVVISPFMNWRDVKTKSEMWAEFPDDPLFPAHALLPLNKSLEQTRFAEAYANEVARTHLDNLNLLYVVFTRAKDRLYAFSSQTGGVAKSLAEVLMRHEYWNPTDRKFTWGQPIPNKTKKSPATQAPVIPAFLSEDWRTKLRMKKRPVSDWFDTERESVRRFGTLSHLVLSSMRYPEDLEPKLNRLMQQGEITAEDKVILREKLSPLLNNAEIANILRFGNRILNERTILAADGSPYRPDRVAIGEGEVYVIDYKTGKPNESHQEQIRHYGDLLAEIGHTGIRLFLIYIQTQTVAEILR